MIEKSLEAARFVHRALIIGCAGLLIISIGGNKSDIKSMRQELAFISKLPDNCKKPLKSIMKNSRRVLADAIISDALSTYKGAMPRAYRKGLGRLKYRYRGRRPVPGDFKCASAKSVRTITDAVRATRRIYHVPLYTGGRYVFIGHAHKAIYVPRHMRDDGIVNRPEFRQRRFCDKEPDYCGKPSPKYRIDVLKDRINLFISNRTRPREKKFTIGLQDRNNSTASPYVWPLDRNGIIFSKELGRVLQQRGEVYVWYPALIEFRARVGVDNLKEVQEIVQKSLLEAGRTPIELFGLKFSQRILESVSPVLIFVTLLYLFMHLKQVTRLLASGSEWNGTLAWFPLYRGLFARTATFISLVLWPPFALVALGIRDLSRADFADLPDIGMVFDLMGGSLWVIWSAGLMFWFGLYLFFLIQRNLTIPARAFLNAWKPIRREWIPSTYYGSNDKPE